MMDTINISDAANYSIMRDGFRYRIKRRHNEMIKDKENLNEEKEEELKHRKGKQMKTTASADIDKIRNSNRRNQKITQSIPLQASKTVQIREEKDLLLLNNIPNQDAKNNDIALLITSKQNNHVQESETKISLYKELERLRSSVTKIELAFEKEKLPEVIMKLTKYCSKTAKKETNLKVKVSNLFSDEMFSLEWANYSDKMSLINLELLFFDLLLGKNHLYNSILEIDIPNIGNILLYYFSQIGLIRALKSLIPLVESNIEKFSEVQIIKLKDIENLANEFKLITLGRIYPLFKANYKLFATIEKNSKKKKVISSEYENVENAEIALCYSNKDFPIKKLSTFELDSEVDRISELFHSNVNSIDDQLKSNAQYNKLIEYVYTNLILLQAHESIIVSNQKRTKASQMKRELTIQNQVLFRKIANMELFYENTANLISDYLESANAC